MIMSKKNKKKKISLIVLFLIIIQILIPFLVLKESIYIITSNSMNPALNRGDLVIKGYKSSEEIIADNKKGDILIIKGPQYYYKKGIDPFFFGYLANNTPIIHRAIDKKKIGDTWYFLTKGDNNLIPDGATKFLIKKEDYYLVECDISKAIYIPESEILGVVKFIIPRIGYLGLYFPLILIMVLSLVSIIIIKNTVNSLKNLKHN